jgi:hypothetical protein
MWKGAVESHAVLWIRIEYIRWLLSLATLEYMYKLSVQNADIEFVIRCTESLRSIGKHNHKATRT